MERRNRIHPVWAAIWFCLTMPAQLLWSAGAAKPAPVPTFPACTVKVIEIREVNGAGAAKVALDLQFESNLSANVTEVELLDFYVEKAQLLPQPDEHPFDLVKSKRNDQELEFNVPLTQQTAPLIEKLGQPVHTTGTVKMKVTQSLTQKAFAKGVTVVQCSFAAEPLLAAKNDSVIEALKKLNTGGDAATVDSGSGPAPVPGTAPTPRPEEWMDLAKQAGAQNLVIVESSSSLSTVTAKLYRQGFRLNDTDIVAPLDPLDSVKAQVSGKMGGFDGLAAQISSLNPGDVRYRAWFAGPAGQAPLPDSPTLPLRLKCKLSTSGSSNLGLFEFTGNPPGVPWRPIVQEVSAPAATTAMQLFFAGLSDHQFSSVSVNVTPLMGSASSLSYAPSRSRFPAASFGSPIFGEQGLLAIVDTEDSATTLTEINRERQSLACTAPPPIVPPPPPPTSTVITSNSGTTYKVKVWSKPEGAYVWVDDKLALDHDMNPITTAASKEACGSGNTLTLSPGTHHIAFRFPGYREFGGDVKVDSDFTLSATLIKAR